MQLPLPFLVTRQLARLVSRALQSPRAAAFTDSPQLPSSDGNTDADGGAGVTELVPVEHHPLEGVPDPAADDADDVGAGAASSTLRAESEPLEDAAADLAGIPWLSSDRTAAATTVAAVDVTAASAPPVINARKSGRNVIKVPTLWTINLNPTAHQRLTILFSVFCAGLPAPCKFPQSLSIEFYTATDMTLGQYIEELVRSTRSACNTCERCVRCSRKGRERVAQGTDQARHPRTGMVSGAGE